MQRRGLPYISAVLVVLALLASACSDDDSSTPPEPAPDESTGAESDVTTTTTLRPPTPTDPPERAAPMIGELDIPCEAGEGQDWPERPGLETDVVTIGTGSDRGGIGTPGAGDGIIEMVEVLVDLCNANGGLGGRDVRVIDYDAAAFEATERVQEACVETVAMVGHRLLQELETALTAEECGLPLFTGGAGLVPTTPFGLHGHVAAVFADPEVAGSVVLIGPDTPLAAFQRAARRQAIESKGDLFTIVGEVTYPIDIVPDWDRIVGEARALGAGQVHVEGGCAQAIVPFAEVAESASWRPVMVATAVAYDDTCRASPQADRLLIELPFLPFEDGDAAPATAAHAELLDQIVAPHTGVGLLAATEFWRWASMAEQCLAVNDAQCWGAARAAQTEWTAGGLHPPLDPDGTSEGCAVVMGIEDDGFVRRLPAEAGTYDCSPELSAVPTPDG